MWAMPGRVMSSMYRPCPVMRRGSSRRWILAPIMVVTAMSAPPRGGLRGRLGCRAAHGGGRRLHRLDDVHVARAAAEVALEAFANLVIGRVRVLLEQVGRSHDHARGAVAALTGVAADVGAGEAGFVADVMHEQEPRLDLVLVPAAVDCSGDLMLHLRPPSSQKGRSTRPAGCKASRVPSRLFGYF